MDQVGHRRRSIRLANYDYSSAGAYFVTICTHKHACLFGENLGGLIRLSDYGSIVQEAWNSLPTHYSHVVLDAFVIMPNHIHGIIVLADGPVGAGFKPAPTPGTRHALPEIVRAFKTFSARRINDFRANRGPVWQRNYYEHVVRNEATLNRIRQYIIDNPARWADDPENLDRPARNRPNL
jgi:putative transposase